MAKHKFVEQTSYDHKGNKQTLRINARKTPAQVSEQARRIANSKGSGLSNNLYVKLVNAENIGYNAKNIDKPISSQVAHHNNVVKSANNYRWRNYPQDDGMLTRVKASSNG